MQSPTAYFFPTLITPLAEVSYLVLVFLGLFMAVLSVPHNSYVNITKIQAAKR